MKPILAIFLNGIINNYNTLLKVSELFYHIPGYQDTFKVNNDERNRNAGRILLLHKT